MKKILFVCHGNICRSPMAEFLMRDVLKKIDREDAFFVESAATSREEIGNPVHYGTRNLLAKLGISTRGKTARQMTKHDYEVFDFLLGMDSYNLQNMLRITGGDPNHKIYRLLDFSDNPRDIADPWYTGNFETTYSDICEGIKAFLSKFSKYNS